MILTKILNVKWSAKNKDWYIKKGYSFTNIKDSFEVNICDLIKYAKGKIEIACDGENCNDIITVEITNYRKTVKEDGKYYCKKCAYKLYGTENYRKTRLKNGKSFEKWCIENNRNDILERWDYELNIYKPNELSHSSNKKVFIKCSKNIHPSELKKINTLTSQGENNKNLHLCLCNKCNSFAQWGIDNLGKDFLEKYWDYSKNIISPWEVSKLSDAKKYWIKCQEDILHESYLVTPSNFISRNSRCPLCNLSKGESKIADYLYDKNIIFIPQKTFDGLVGLSDGLLSYDFYLPKFNLLIEYQGEFHDHAILNYKDEPIELAEARLEQQQEHDKRKKDYAKSKEIWLLEIWYWDFDNIESILDKYLKQVIY
jgi:hypothetical protein